jgi:polyhydroxybutyrate depolymerase
MKHLILIIFFLPITLVGQQTLTKTLSHDGISREYILYVPAIYDSSQETPLVLNFHGYGSNASEQMFYGNFRTIADTAGFIIAHPLGTLDNSGTAHWNVGWGASTVDDIGFTAALIDAISADYAINQKRIYSTGMSNGGFMSYKLACELSDKIAAIASVTGTMNKGQFNQCNPTHPMPVMEIHGTTDAIVPYNGANWIEGSEDVVAFWADYNNCDTPADINQIENTNTTDGSTVEHWIYKNGDNDTRVELFKIMGGAHTWPGSILPFPGTNYDINASKEIWRFFSMYDIDGKISTSSSLEYDLSENVIIQQNPVASMINIELKNIGKVNYLLHDMNGRQLINGTLNNGNNSINIGHLNNGMYLLNVAGTSFKIIKFQ